MQINSLPNPAVSLMRARPQLQNNLVLHARSNGKYHYPDHPTPYMFIANPNSWGNYVVNKQRLSLSGNDFLLLNTDDVLSINYGRDLIESFFILFEDSFIHQSYHVVTSDDKNLLANPFDKATEKNLNLGSLPFKTNKEITSLLSGIAGDCCNQDELDEKLFYLLRKIAYLKSRRAEDIDKIKAVKKATKVELYRRLMIAREYIEGNFSRARLNLDEIARFSSLDKFHLILNFKQLYDTTPHQYLICIRLNKAYELMRSGHYSITEVCYLTGFESLPTFSSLFKKTFGVPPSLIVKSEKSSVL